MTMLEVRNLRVHYDRVEAIKGVSLDLDRGSIVTLIGNNGSGKSTIIRTISGLQRPTSGEILFEQGTIHGMPPQDIVRLGIAQVPEGRMIFPDMTVMDNLRTGAYLRRDKQGIRHDFEMVMDHFPVLKDRFKQKAGSLSGGEQQMLAIGRALVSSPRILLLDEPSMGLSPLFVKEIGRIITRINQNGISIILVEQNARLALRVAQWGYVLETGKIVLNGDTQSLVSNEQVKKAYLGG
jgi:branched-chain amino acid transport system ATP-binding protein